MTSTATYSCDDCGYQHTIEHGRDVSPERIPCPECGSDSRATTVKPTGSVAAFGEVGDPKGVDPADG